MRQHTAEVTRRAPGGLCAYKCTIVACGITHTGLGESPRDAYTRAYRYIRNRIPLETRPTSNACPDCGGKLRERMVPVGMDECGVPEYDPYHVCQDCGEEFDAFMLQFV